MTESSLSIKFSNNASGVIIDPYWLNMEIVSEEHEDGMTLSEASNLVNEIFEIEECGKEDPDVWNKTEARETALSAEREALLFSPDRLNSIFTSVLAAQPDCVDSVNMESDPGSYDIKIKVHRSHQLELYKLRLSNGTASSPQRIDTERIEENLDLTDATHVTVDKYVDGGAETQWLGIDGPEVKKLGNTFYWDIPVTGTLRVSYGTVYDLISIHVHGQQGESELITGTMPPDTWGEGFYSGNESGQEIDTVQNIKCSVLAFYHYQYEELQLTKPELDSSVPDSDMDTLCSTTVLSSQTDVGDRDPIDRDCYQETTQTTLCLCSKDKSTEKSLKVVVCPDGVNTGVYLDPIETPPEYKDCGERESSYDPDTYESLCCEPVPADFCSLFYNCGLGGLRGTKALPWCKSRFTEYLGGKEVDPEQKTALLKDYPDAVFIGVPPPSTGCGEWEVEQLMDQQQCCDGITEIVIDEENSVDTISDNSFGLVYINGGKQPYTVSVRGDGFYMDDARTKTEISIIGYGSATIFTADACGAATVTVTDGCSTDTYSLKSSTGSWQAVRTGCFPEFSGREADTLFDYVDGEYFTGFYLSATSYVVQGFRTTQIPTDQCCYNWLPCVDERMPACTNAAVVPEATPWDYCFDISIRFVYEETDNPFVEDLTGLYENTSHGTWWYSPPSGDACYILGSNEPNACRFGLWRKDYSGHPTEYRWLC